MKSHGPLAKMVFGNLVLTPLQLAASNLLGDSQRKTRLVSLHPKYEGDAFPQPSP